RPGRRPPAFSDRVPFGDGSLVVLSGGCLWAGYEGSLARTWWCGDRGGPTCAQRLLYRRWRAVMDRLLERCRAGASGADLAAAYGDEPLPPFPVAASVGLGQEGPVAGSAAGADLDRRHVLEPGMVLCLRGWVSGDEGGFF